jgi:hypothetical protein
MQLETSVEGDSETTSRPLGPTRALHATVKSYVRRRRTTLVMEMMERRCGTGEITQIRDEVQRRGGSAPSFSLLRRVHHEACLVRSSRTVVIGTDEGIACCQPLVDDRHECFVRSLSSGRCMALKVLELRTQ